jgi:hypothetical protein
LLLIFFPGLKEKNTDKRNINYTPKSEISRSYLHGNCCCSFGVDIRIEELMPSSRCLNQIRGQCIEVDPLRLTPHSCCPDAPGERCDSLFTQDN